jgi:hypothetical protein
MEVELKFRGDVTVSTDWEDYGVTVLGDLCSDSIDEELKVSIESVRRELVKVLGENSRLEAEITKLKDLILDIQKVNRKMEGIDFKC